VSPAQDPFGARDRLEAGGRSYAVTRLDALGADLDRMPYTVKVLLENVLRNVGREFVSEDDVRALAGWRPASGRSSEVPYLPARVVLQDFTGVPCVVDLAAMRDAMTALGGDAGRINPLVPADLVIDHSVQVDRFGSQEAFAANVAREYERNGERYALLRWAQQAFADFRVVPPGTGIVHQVNLEYLAEAVLAREVDGELWAFPDTLVGTDSHTTMINGLGVLGFGVGGIEAEAVLLGQPLSQPTPAIVGIKMRGALPTGATATDLVLTVTEMLRAHGVVGKFVEFHGAGLSSLALADRATISNMSPEFGATAAMFPIDAETLRYLAMTGRSPELVARVEAYARLQGLFRTDDSPEPEFDESLELDLAAVEPSLAGPRRPQDRVPLGAVGREFREHYADGLTGNGQGPHYAPVDVELEGAHFPLATGSVAIAAITSCTNTSNPSVMVGAGLLAKKAVKRGLRTPPWVKTSLAPGSRAVSGYLEKAGLTPYLDELRFDLVGYGCTTCIGNSGPLAEPIARAIDDNGLVAAAVLSGNRNFEGRIHPQIRASYLASPPLVVAYALAGRVDIDLTSEPLGEDREGRPVFLREIWPSASEIAEAVGESVTAELFAASYASVFEGDDRWRALPVPAGDTYAWDPDSTYVANPPFFADLAAEPGPVADIVGARALCVLADSVTTDHISPAGSIPATSPAGRWLQERGVTPRDFNSFGSRRGHHEVMMRGTFGNIRLRNALADGREGNWTTHLPSGELTSVYEAAMRYGEEGTPLLVVAGKEYGTGSSRDWAAKGTALLGVRAVLAETYERIHRGNLVGMGVLPLQYQPGESAASLGLTGRETFAVRGLDALTPRQTVEIEVSGEDGATRTIRALARIDGPTELTYYRNGGILPTVLRRLHREGEPPRG
jgi:aconitate hydratase A / 2-methylisocitrate dehydratase